MARWDNQRQGLRYSPKRWHSWTQLVNAGTHQNCIGSKAHSCSNCPQTIRLKPKPVFNTPSASPKTSKQSPSSYEQQQVSLGSGNSKGSATKQGRCLRRSTVGSPKDLIPLICKTPRHYWMS